MYRLSLRTGYSYTSVIVVSGESSVYLNGDTTISGEFPLGFAGVIRVQDKALLEIGSGATLTMQDIDSFEHHGTRTPELTYADSGAKIVNKGTCRFNWSTQQLCENMGLRRFFE